MASAVSGRYSQGRANYELTASIGRVDVKRTLTVGGFQCRRMMVELLGTKTNSFLHRS